MRAEAIQTDLPRGDPDPSDVAARGSQVCAPEMLVVIVNYRTADVAIECLRSLAGQVDGARRRVVVVDNASPDGSAERIDAAAAAGGWRWAEVVRSARNAGFGAGNNVGVKRALAMSPPPALVFLLNPDTIAPAGALDRAARAMAEHPRCGVLGCSLRGPAGNLHSNAFRFPSAWSELEEGARFAPLTRLLERRRVVRTPPEQPDSADWVSGAAMVVRREVWETVGLMDESFFLYFEEVDLCRRVRAAGWEVRYLPGVDIVHLEGVATGCGHRGGEARERRRRPRWWYDSRRRYFVKHHGWGGLICADLLWGLGRFTLTLRRALRLGGDVASDPLGFSADLLGGDLRALVRAALGRGGGA